MFSWQGGEPTLRGLDFFCRVVALQKKCAKPNQRIENDLQTNGVLIDEDWAAFLKDNCFLVGLSIDGSRELHDKYRVNKGGAPTFDKVMAAANLLRKRGVRFNTLTCVHRGNASRPLDVYRFLRRELDSTAIRKSASAMPGQLTSASKRFRHALGMDVRTLRRYATTEVRNILECTKFVNSARSEVAMNSLLKVTLGRFNR